ncbi:MAG: Ran-binding zinc finger domain-containing protein, partial [Gemmatimonadota bacterium]
TVRAQLEQRKVRKEELQAEEAKAKETLAEAELRHAVGEYDEGDWTKVRADSNKLLVSLREELAKVVEDIERLAEVAKLIAAPPPPEPKAVVPEPKAPPPPPTAEAVDATATGPQKRESGRAEFVPSAVKAKPPADELEFLRATVGEAEAAPLPKMTRLERDKRPKAEPAAAPAPSEAPVVAAAEEAELPKPKGTPEVRTLKCPECGTMNRPTEWYCERCGSELAGV